MTSLMGNLGLGLAVVFSLATLLLCMAAHRLRDPVWLARARWGLALSAGSFLVATAALGFALLQGDLRFAYVAGHTERALSPAYRLAAFWSGQEGSLLLWGVMASCFGVAAAFGRRRVAEAGEAVTLAVFAVLNMFFGLVLVFAADPFAAELGVTADGRGLNPQLQHWAMIAHPPTLFMGYAGFCVPFAVMCGALAAGRKDNAWVAQMRRWVLVAWLFLGAGIALGAWWAYVELGWGGYWAWDPVENASFLPWLTGTALLHTIIVHEHRGMLKEWTAGLASATFILCIFGTYITRSGVLQSVHAFSQSEIGVYFLSLLVTLIVGTTGLVTWRRKLLVSEHRLDGLLGREGLSLVGNTLLSAMALVTLIGTIFPLLSQLVTSSPVSVGQSFYNRTVAPLGLAAAALLAVAPLLVYGRAAAGVLGRAILAPACGGVVAAGGAYTFGLHNPIALICVAVSGVAFLATAISFGQAIIASRRHTGRGIVTGAVWVIDGNHRRYGGQIAHLGVVLIILGIMGSGLFSVTTARTLQAGETFELGRWTLRLDGMRQVEGDNYLAAEAAVSVLEGDRVVRTLRPQRRFYNKSEEAAAAVSISTSWREDLYVALVGWEDAGAKAAIQVWINPMTLWIWIGAGTMVAGGALCLMPRLLGRTRTAGAAAPTERRETRGTGAPATV